MDIPEMKSFSVNIVLDSTNSAENDCPVTAINFKTKNNRETDYHRQRHNDMIQFVIYNFNKKNG